MAIIGNFRLSVRYFACLLAPLSARNILFLARGNDSGKILALRLIRVYLRLFYRAGLGPGLADQLASKGKELPSDIVRALGCLGFLKLGYELRRARQGNGPVPVSLYGVDRLRPDPILESAVRGRSVAVVGPSKGGDNAAEIDGFDVVVRIGYSGPDGLPVSTGERCDVSFYATHKIKGLHAQGKLHFLSVPKVIVVTAKKSKQKPLRVLKEAGVAVDNLAFQTRPDFNETGLNALVKVIFNCIISGASRIKVFNADLFLSSQYPKGYLANKSITENAATWSYDSAGMCYSLSLYHLPEHQLRFYKTFYQRGAFEADLRLSEVISMDEEEYISQLDAIYGLPVRARLGLS